ncbi:uncharacterized protein H6S33_008114 [Morchella sextelata]|uniref:uncharacterized protein n=1 Tax=Morchella sextelata TaxID=1174677 RepID=UPI001D0419D9|nr:uncharacterized protein H6S33_008114 [Morchella sextelata]KAH0603110.1 hypothetical protein H6S33_008114 [Morchella sextelata]
MVQKSVLLSSLQDSSTHSGHFLPRLFVFPHAEIDSVWRRPSRAIDSACSNSFIIREKGIHSMLHKQFNHRGFAHQHREVKWRSPEPIPDVDIGPELMTVHTAEW